MLLHIYQNLKSRTLFIAILMGMALASSNASGVQPTISSIVPASGTSAGGTRVTIQGSNFQTGATATIGGLALSNLVVQSNSIQGTTPAHVAGGAEVVVTNPGGQSSVFKALLHNQGFEAGSTEWLFLGAGTGTIVGNVYNAHNGRRYAEVRSAKLGDHPQFFVASNSGQSQYFPVNPGDVVAFGGWAYRASGDGKARWGIEISDSGKTNPTFLGAAPFNVRNSQWQLQKTSYTVPNGKAFIRMYCEIVSNTTAAVARFDDAILQISPSATYGYTFISPPIVTSISPNWGAPAGGATRTVFGTGFTNGDTVALGGAAGTNPVVSSANAISFFAPPNAEGTVNVTVTGAEQQRSTLAGAYTYKVPPSPPAGMTKIHHIIFELQENRSFDNYFGVMNQYRASQGINDNAVDQLNLSKALPDIAGEMITPFHLQTECVENTTPSWNASHIDYDNGLMDNFMKTGNLFAHSSTIDRNGTRAMGYYDWTDLPYYYALAFNFGTSDRYFSSVMGPTGPNRAYSFAGTSLGFVGTLQPPSGGFPNLTIFDLLDRAGVSWKYYYQSTGPSWITPWSVYFKDQNKIVPLNPGYYDDLGDESRFPQVVFIEENGNKDEHPKPDPGTTGLTQNIQQGADLLSHIIGALMASPSWPSSVFILTWDEGGGIHDHAVPPSMPRPDGYPPQTSPTRDRPGLFNQAGFRVPLIVVSPWIRPHLVSHTIRDHTAILKFIETRFSLPPLTSRDAAADNMTEFFDFSSPAWLTPPILPTQPTNGTCDLNLEKAPGQ